MQSWLNYLCLTNTYRYACSESGIIDDAFFNWLDFKVGVDNASNLFLLNAEPIQYIPLRLIYCS
jgi:hypothetical protein